MNCREFNENVSLYLYDELGQSERESFDEHQAACPACRDRLEQTRRLHQVLAGRTSPEITPQILAQCRIALDDALDRELAAVGWKDLLERWFQGFGLARPSRAVAGLSLIALGFGLGWTIRPAAGPSSPAIGITAADLGNLRINNISQVPSASGNGEVRITVDADRHMTLEGSLDDPRIREVLVNAVKDYDNPGIRHDSLDVLRSKADNPSVRAALLYALQNDPNTGVRLEALEEAQELAWSPEVRQALLNTLEKDKNDGVRVAAVDVLTGHADDSIRPALERLAATDSNRYVRLKSLTALRELNGGQN